MKFSLRLNRLGKNPTSNFQTASLDATSGEDLLTAHCLLMTALADDAGRFRSGVVGIFRGKQLAHMAPPVDRVTADGRPARMIFVKPI